MNWWDLLKDGSKILFGGLLGFGFGWWGHILRERVDGARLRSALYQELANCYEAVRHHTSPDRTDFEFLKTKLEHEVVFVAFEAAPRNPSVLCGIAERGWLIGCYREVRKLCELAPETNQNDLINLLTQRSAWLRIPRTRMRGGCSLRRSSCRTASISR